MTSARGRRPARTLAVDSGMRKINLLAVHCTATLEGRPFTRDDIDAMHRRQGWSEIGYHYLIELDGTVAEGRDVQRPGAHIKGHNAQSIGICYVGGIGRDGKAKDTRTDAQKASLAQLLRHLRASYPLTLIRGHRDMSPDRDGDGVVEPHEWLKMCPCFDVVEWCRSVGIDPR